MIAVFGKGALASSPAHEPLAVRVRRKVGGVDGEVAAHIEVLPVQAVPRPEEARALIRAVPEGDRSIWATAGEDELGGLVPRRSAGPAHRAPPRDSYRNLSTGD
jgi:hypothetical protein